MERLLQRPSQPYPATLTRVLTDNPPYLLATVGCFGLANFEAIEPLTLTC